MSDARSDAEWLAAAEVMRARAVIFRAQVLDGIAAGRLNPTMMETVDRVSAAIEQIDAAVDDTARRARAEAS